MPCASTVHSASESPSASVSISAQELHEILVTTHTSLNLTKRRFIDALRSLAKSRLFLHLGFPSIVAYSSATFRVGKSQTYEYLRVAEALQRLPEIAGAFERGKISFTLTAKLTRIASPETESEWLALARAQSVEATVAEIHAALKRNRPRPRKGSFGLPGLSVLLKLEFSPEEHAVIERGFAKVCDEMAAGLDDARPAPEKVLLYLMDRILHEHPAPPASSPTEPHAHTPPNADPRSPHSPPSPYMVAFVRCPDCHRAAVETAAGRVEVDADKLSKFAGSAERVDIAPERELAPGTVVAKAGAPGPAIPEAERAPPNSDVLRRELRARAGGRCENPHCRRDTRRAGHGHHMVPRSTGGATALWNEVHLCERCHSLVHAGCLEISGNRLDGLVWTPRAADFTRQVRAELERTRRLPELRLVERAESGHPESEVTGAAESGHPESEAAQDPAIADAIAALRSLGYAKPAANARALRAWRHLRAHADPGTSTRAATSSVPELITEALRH